MAVLLGKSYSTIRKWDDKKIGKELQKQCWKIISTHKTGNKVTFILEYEEQDFNINEYIEDEYKVKEGGKFVKHTKIRVDGIEKDTPKTRKEISEEVGVTEKTIKNYDKKLEEKEVIKKDGYYHVPYTHIVESEPIPSQYEELYQEVRAFFNSHIRNTVVQSCCENCGATKDLHVHHNKPLSVVFNNLLRQGIADQQTILDKAVVEQMRYSFTTLCKKCHLGDVHGYYKVTKYKVNKDNEFYKMIMNNNH